MGMYLYPFARIVNAVHFLSLSCLTPLYFGNKQNPLTTQRKRKTTKTEDLFISSVKGKKEKDYISYSSDILAYFFGFVQAQIAKYNKPV